MTRKDGRPRSLPQNPEPVAFEDYENTNGVVMSDGSIRDYFELQAERISA